MQSHSDTDIEVAVTPKSVSRPPAPPARSESLVERFGLLISPLKILDGPADPLALGLRPPAEAKP